MSAPPTASALPLPAGGVPRAAQPRASPRAIAADALVLLQTAGAPLCPFVGCTASCEAKKNQHGDVCYRNGCSVHREDKALVATGGLVALAERGFSTSRVPFMRAVSAQQEAPPTLPTEREIDLVAWATGPSACAARHCALGQRRLTLRPGYRAQERK